MSELKSSIPLDRFRLQMDPDLLKHLKSTMAQQNFHKYLRDHLAGKS